MNRVRLLLAFAFVLDEASNKASSEEFSVDKYPEIVDLVDQLPYGFKDSNLNGTSKAEIFRNDNDRDIRSLIVRLCDQVYTIRHLERMNPLTQECVVNETLKLYIPLADRLGLHKLQHELQDLIFPYVEPAGYEYLLNAVGDTETEREGYLASTRKIFHEYLSRKNLDVRITGRLKNLSSIWRKMKMLKIALSDVHDLIAFRVITKSVNDSYAVLHAIHGQWKPELSRFGDYIARPKSNGYQSIHTKVIGPEGREVEIQIRTEDMHRVAEYGSAGHWLYKKGPRTKSYGFGKASSG